MSPHPYDWCDSGDDVDEEVDDLEESSSATPVAASFSPSYVITAEITTDWNKNTCTVSMYSIEEQDRHGKVTTYYITGLAWRHTIICRRAKVVDEPHFCHNETTVVTTKTIADE